MNAQCSTAPSSFSPKRSRIAATSFAVATVAVVLLAVMLVDSALTLPAHAQAQADPQSATADAPLQAADPQLRAADRFVDAVHNDAALPADVREMIARTWKECEDCDGEEFLTQGLAVLSEPFRGGLDAYDDDDYETCATTMASLRDDENPFVAVNAAVYEIKALVAKDRLLEAGERIVALGASGADRVAAYSYFAPELDFLHGYCLLADVQYAAAAMALQRFLIDHPNSSQRLTLAAKQMLAELAGRASGAIGDVVDLMDFSGRRLANFDSGDLVQGRQQEILDLLDKMIEEAEAQEQASANSSSGGGGGSQGQAPSNPMQESQLPGSGPAPGPQRESRRASPGEAWGAMKPAQREKILQALRDSFPGRYRRLVEQYYEELAKKP